DSFAVQLPARLLFESPGGLSFTLEPEPEAGAGREDVVDEDIRTGRCEGVTPVVREQGARVEGYALGPLVSDQPAVGIDIAAQVVAGILPGNGYAEEVARQADPHVGQARVELRREVVVEAEVRDLDLLRLAGKGGRPARTDILAVDVADEGDVHVGRRI